VLKKPNENSCDNLSKQNCNQGYKDVEAFKKEDNTNVEVAGSEFHHISRIRAESLIDG